MDNPSPDAELVEQIISDLLAVLIGRAFCQPCFFSEGFRTVHNVKISLSILDAMLSWFPRCVVEAGGVVSLSSRGVLNDFGKSP
ncbi:unnamed protein product, partial [Staurois parvus]